MSEALETRLVALAADLDVPVPAGLATDVLSRVRELPAPRARARSLRRWFAALLVALLGTGVVATPVGASIREFFGFHGVLVSEPDGQAPKGTPVVPSEASGLTLDEAEQRAGFAPVLPGVLGVPVGVGVSADRRVVSLTWGSAWTTVRLDQFRGDLDPVFWKTADDATPVRLGTSEGLWFPSPHAVRLVAEDGGLHTLAPRLSAPTLVWMRGELTLRLEGATSLAEARAIAESVP